MQSQIPGISLLEQEIESPQHELGGQGWPVTGVTERAMTAQGRWEVGGGETKVRSAHAFKEVLVFETVWKNGIFLYTWPLLGK